MWAGVLFGHQDMMQFWSESWAQVPADTAPSHAQLEEVCNCYNRLTEARLTQGRLSDAAFQNLSDRVKRHERLNEQALDDYVLEVALRTREGRGLLTLNPAPPEMLQTFRLTCESTDTTRAQLQFDTSGSEMYDTFEEADDQYKQWLESEGRGADYMAPTWEMKDFLAQYG